MKPSHIITDGGQNKAGIADKRNCTVVALAVASGLPYSVADSIATGAGRKRKCAFHTSKLIAAAKEKGIESCPVEFSRMTLARFIESFPSGRYVVRVRGHAVALIEGTLYDTQQTSLRRFATHAWLFDSVRLGAIKERFESTCCTL